MFFWTHENSRNACAYYLAMKAIMMDKKTLQDYCKEVNVPFKVLGAVKCTDCIHQRRSSALLQQRHRKLFMMLWGGYVRFDRYRGLLPLLREHILVIGTVDRLHPPHQYACCHAHPSHPLGPSNQFHSVCDWGFNRGADFRIGVNMCRFKLIFYGTCWRSSLRNTDCHLPSLFDMCILVTLRTSIQARSML